MCEGKNFSYEMIPTTVCSIVLEFASVLNRISQKTSLVGMAINEQPRRMQQRIARFSDIPPEFNETPITSFNNDETPVLPLSIAIEPIESIYPQIQFYASAAIGQCKNPPDDGLSIDESAAIRLFSMETQLHDKPLYAILNDALRSRNTEKIQPWLHYFKLLRTALSRLPSVSGTVFRGVKLYSAGKHQKGETIVWPSFSSCTMMIDVLESQSFCGKHNDRTMFVINCTSGRNIQNHSYYTEESEILLLPESSFKVIACLDQGSGLQMIHLQQLDKPPSPLEPCIVPALCGTFAGK